MKNVMRFSMKNDFLKSICLILVMLSLSSCLYMMGDKFDEQIDCPINEGQNVIDLKYPSCSPPSLYIPKNYAPTCNTPWPIQRESPIESVAFIISYPDFLPVKNGSVSYLKDKQIYIKIGPSCAWGKKEKSFSQENAEYIQKNTTYTDPPFGKKQFAPIKYLGDGMYLQKNVREPYLSGNASIYFYVDKGGRIPFEFLCNGEGRCDSGGGTDDGLYRYNYFFYGIDYEEFYSIDQKMKSFISNLKSKGTD